MAGSASHTLGELIGNFFEEAMKLPMRRVANKHGLYFDCKGKRVARKSLKVTWVDINGSSHDLDYVIEKNGSETTIGHPIAFIELAWRRYTKHSKNKVQEITAAITPVVQKYSDYNPFKGAILCGVFTESSLRQLEGQGFCVLYIPYSKMVRVFKDHNVDIFYDETTEEKVFEDKIQQFAMADKKAITEDLLKHSKSEIDAFTTALEKVINRTIKSVYVLPLHGKAEILPSADAAISYIDSYSEIPANVAIQLYIIQVSFNDGSEIKGEFKDKVLAKAFLKNMKSLEI